VIDHERQIKPSGMIGQYGHTDEPPPLLGDPRLPDEVLEPLLARLEPAEGVRLVGRTEPVALANPFVPADDLLELRSDLLRLLVGEVAAEGLELYLLRGS